MLAAAHHPLFSNGVHGDNGVLQVEWGPLFKKYQLDFYICGHDHDLQHLEIPGWSTSFLLVGGGGGGNRPMLRSDRGPFSRGVHGFAHLRLSADLAECRFIHGLDGSILHEFERDRSGYVKTIVNTGRDKPTSKPLKAIQGLEK